MFFFLLLILIDWNISSAQVRTRAPHLRPPDMCLHSSRYNSMTQFSFNANRTDRSGYFLTSGYYYWTIKSKELATPNNVKGVIPFGFRGDAAFFRLWKRCEDNQTVPMIVLVDKTLPSQPLFRYLIYFLETESWSVRPFDVSNDIILKKIKLYPGIDTIDDIMNFANIRDGPYAEQLGDESLFIMSTATNNSMYYDWVRVTGSCFARNNISEGRGRVLEFFNGPLERALWKMDQSLDAAMVYINYNRRNWNDITFADISLFQGNTHYLFVTPLELIKMGLFFCNKSSLIAQYYSTWMDCAQGLTPEPPYNPFVSTTVSAQTNAIFNDSTTEIIEELINGTTWRPAIPHENPVHSPNHEDEGTLSATVFSVLLVIIVGSAIIVLNVFTNCNQIDSDETD